MFKFIKKLLYNYPFFILFSIVITLSIISFNLFISWKQTTFYYKKETIKKVKIIRKLEKENKKLKEKLEKCYSKKNNITKEEIFKIVKPYIAKHVPYSIANEIIDETLKYYYPDPLFINAIIIVESNYDIFAKSNKKAVGCMQVNYKVWEKELKNNGIIKEYRDLFDPKICVKAGMYILMKYYNQTGNWEKALYKYVGGSKKYVNKVFRVYGILNMKLVESRLDGKEKL